MVPYCLGRHRSGGTTVAHGTVAHVPRAALDEPNRLSRFPHACVPAVVISIDKFLHSIRSY